jgi:hypothetical protein
MEGLEPPCLAALDPKSSASTNFATSAFYFYYVLFQLNNHPFLKWDCKVSKIFISARDSLKYFHGC